MSGTAPEVAICNLLLDGRARTARVFSLGGASGENADAPATSASKRAATYEQNIARKMASRAQTFTVTDRIRRTLKMDVKNGLSPAAHVNLYARYLSMLKGDPKNNLPSWRFGPASAFFCKNNFCLTTKKI